MVLLTSSNKGQSLVLLVSRDKDQYELVLYARPHETRMSSALRSTCRKNVWIKANFWAHTYTKKREVIACRLNGNTCSPIIVGLRQCVQPRPAPFPTFLKKLFRGYRERSKRRPPRPALAANAGLREVPVKVGGSGRSPVTEVPLITLIALAKADRI